MDSEFLDPRFWSGIIEKLPAFFMALSRQDLPVTPIALMGALMLDAWWGDGGRLGRLLPHPRRLFARLVHSADLAMNRDNRSEKVRRTRGLAVTLMVVFVALLSGVIAWLLTRLLPWGWVLEMLLLLSALSQREPVRQTEAVRKDLSGKSVEIARRRLESFMKSDASNLDGHGVVRMTIETAGRRFCDGGVTPLFWHAILGLPGLFLVTGLDALGEQVRSTDNRYLSFGRSGRAAAAFIRALPARLTGLFLCLAALLVPGSSFGRGLACWLRDSHKLPPSSQGITSAVLAGACGLSLGGPRRYPNRVVPGEWLHKKGRARGLPSDLRRAGFLISLASLLNALLFLGLALLWVQIFHILSAEGVL